MPLVLMLTAAVAAAAGALAVQSAMERPIAAAQARTVVLRARADEAMTALVSALSSTSSWSAVPAAGVAASGLTETAQLTVGTRVVMVAPLTARLNTRVAAEWPRGPSAPRWRTVGGQTTGQTGVLGWVADDPADPDGSPLSDANDRVLVRVHAFGATGGELAVQALVARVTGVTRVLTWREDW